MCPVASWAWPADRAASSAASIVIGALGGGAGDRPAASSSASARSRWGLHADRRRARRRALERIRVQAGAEALCGAPRRSCATGASPEARSSSTARCGARGATGRRATTEALHEGDPVVVERVNGLTLCVRRGRRLGADPDDRWRCRSSWPSTDRRRSSSSWAHPLRVLREYERGVVFRLGRVMKPARPGLDPARCRRGPAWCASSLRTVTLKIRAQDLITRDNVPARVTAVAYYRVIDPTQVGD